MHPKLEHLSEDQLQELIRRYYEPEPEFTVRQIIADFEIDARPGELSSLLPDTIHDEVCVYCDGTNLRSKARSRSGYSSHPPTCPKCGHQPRGYCWCTHCREVAALAEAEDKREKREQIRRHYGPEFWADPTPVFALNLKQAIYLKSVIGHFSSEDLQIVDPYYHTQVPFSPDQSLTRNVLSTLYRETHSIAPCPESSIEGFSFGDAEDVPGFYWDRVNIRLLPSLGVNERRAYLNELEDHLDQLSYEPEIASEEWRIWTDLVKFEALEYYKYKLDEIGVSLNEQGERSDIVFENLATRFPLSRIYQIIYATIKNTHLYIAQKRIPRARWGNMYVGAVERNANHYEAQGWLKDYRRDYNCPQSTLSATFFSGYLGIGDNYFTASPPEKQT